MRNHLQALARDFVDMALATLRGEWGRDSIRNFAAYIRSTLRNEFQVHARPDTPHGEFVLELTFDAGLGPAIGPLIGAELFEALMPHLAHLGKVELTVERVIFSGQADYVGFTLVACPLTVGG